MRLVAGWSTSGSPRRPGCTARAGLRAVVGAALAALVLGGCSGQGGNTVTIGYTGPLSGGASLYGKNARRGVQMAIDELNEDGGLMVAGESYRLELVALDDRYYPNESATNAKRLTHQYAAPVVFCPHSGGILAIQGFNADGRDDFLLGAYSSEPAILEQDNPLTVMIPPRYDAYFEPFARKMMAEHGDRLGLIPGSHAYAKEWTRGFTATWERLGGTVLSNNEIDYNTAADFSSVVSKALSEDPDVLFVGGPSQPTALVVEAAREQGFEGGFAVMDQAKFEEMDDVVPRQALSGSIGVMPLVHYPTDSARRFVRKYREYSGDPDAEPPSEIGLNYQAMHIFARAMQLAGSVDDPRAIRAAVGEATRTLNPGYAPYEMAGVDDRGHLLGTIIAAYVEDGEFVPMELEEPE